MRNIEEYQKYIKEKQDIIENISNDKWALNFHLMPLIGWLNDPNGLCKIDDTYHIYFQYTPEDCFWGSKCWGHVTTKDFYSYSYEQPFMFPDNEADKDGVYSGSCFQKEGLNYFFYTGNLKHIGDFDYINAGREQNTLMVISEDGYHYQNKRLLLTNDDYPSTMSCHVRDPQIFAYQDKYYMFLGARSKTDEAGVLIYQSNNLSDWQYCDTWLTPDYGYMLECPNFIHLDDAYYLICCPQGVSNQKYQFQNVYSSGYFTIGDDQRPKDYFELDYGFDFYAPQVFNDGEETIMIAWMGIPDADYTNPTTDKFWQHALTIPRKLVSNNGHIHQYPIEQMKQYRLSSYSDITITPFLEAYELYLRNDDDHLVLILAQGVILEYCNGLLTLDISEVGYGRQKRYIACDYLSDLHIFKDKSSVEIFVNDGLYTMTSRIYPTSNQKVTISGKVKDVVIYQLDKLHLK